MNIESKNNLLRKNLYAPGPKNIGLHALEVFSHDGQVNPSKLAAWQSLAAEEITIPTLASFLKEEAVRIKNELSVRIEQIRHPRDEDYTIPSQYLLSLGEEIDNLELAGDINSSQGKSVAQEYFAKRYAEALYMLRNDTNTFMHPVLNDHTELDVIILAVSEKALEIL